GAVRVVSLSYHYIDEPVFRPCFESDVTPDTGRHEARTPVPAELALLLPDSRATSDGVVDLARRMLGAMRADVVHRATKADAQFVAAAAQERFHVPAVTDEHVVRARDFRVVEDNGGNRVQAVGDELDHLLGEQLRLDGEGRAVLPLALLDPLERLLVRAPERVRNEPVPAQVGVHATGHDGAAPRRTCGRVAELPDGGREGKVNHVVKEDRERVRYRKQFSRRSFA